jgi:PAS domain S-box
MTLQHGAMPAYHDPLLVALSILVSIVAAYAARALIERLRDADGRAWFIWWLCSSIVDGISIWSMHYTAMFGFQLPVPIWYHWPTVLLSLLIGILGSAASLFIVSRSRIGWMQRIAASVFLGAGGISGLHYTAMVAMRLQGMENYSPTLVILSITMAVLCILISLWLMFDVQDHTRIQVWRYHASAISRGAANPVMHFIAMAAVFFTHSNAVPDLSHVVKITSLGVAGISVVPIMVLIVSLLTTFVDRLQRQRTLLDELFEQAPQAVALMSSDNRVVRVNREFTRLFGYTRDEVLGRRLDDLILPDEAREEDQKYGNLVTSGQRVDVEDMRLRKDRSRLHVSIILVPVTLPGRQVETYAIFRDITERKRAEAERERLFEELGQSHEQLRALSNQLREVQEAERKRLAREIHDDISQTLTASIMQLGTAKSLLPKSAKSAHTILEQTEELIKNTLERTRSIIYDLRPQVLDDLGLVPALHRLGHELQESTGTAVKIKTSRLSKRLPAPIEVALFRIVQEALVNIRKHAQARHVILSLAKESERIILSVQDDGIGFERQANRSCASGDKIPEEDWVIPAGHFGLIGIQERITQLGGKLQVLSAPGDGTTLRVELPLGDESKS